MSLKYCISFCLLMYFSLPSIWANTIEETIKQGHDYCESGKHELALKTYLSIYSEISKLPTSDREVSHFYRELTNLFGILGAKEMALKYAKLTYFSQKTTKDTAAIYLSLGQIGSFYLEMEKYDSANIYFEKALAIIKKTKETFFTIGAYNNMGMLRFKQNSETAKSYYDSALVLIQKNHFEERGIFASINDNLVEFYISEKNYTKALFYCNHIEKWLANSVTEKKGKRYIAMSLKKAECLWKMGNIAAALQTLTKLDSAFTKVEYSSLQQQFYQHYIDIYAEKKDYEKVSLYQNKLLICIREILQKREEFTYKANEDISEIRFHFFQKELEYANWEQEAFKKKAFVTAFAFFLIVAMAYIFYRRKLKWQQREFALKQIQKEIALQNVALQKENAEISLTKEKIEREHAENLLKTAQLEKENVEISLQYRKKELANMVTYLSDGREWNETLLERLAAIESTKDKKQKDLLRETMMDIRNRLTIDDRIHLVHENMGILNQEFYATMREKYPELSLTELEICAYFRMNLANKDISALRNTSLKAVQMARYRIRKKLEIESDEDIHAFLQNI